MTPFFFVWSGQALSLLGSGLVQFAIIWWLTALTGSPVVLALAAMAGVLPRIILSPIAGAAVDRWNRRLVLVAADGLVATATGTLAILFALGIQEVWIVLVVLFVRSVGDAFHRPAMITTTTLMVPRRHYSRIAGLNTALRGTTEVLAPPAGALLLALLPIQSILAIDVVTAILAIVPVLIVRIPPPIRTKDSLKAGVWKDMIAGLAYIRSWPGLTYLIGIYAAVHLVLAPAFAMTPLLVSGFFGGGAADLAWMESAAGVGLIAGGLLLGVWGGTTRRMVAANAALMLLGVGVLMTGLAPKSWFVLAVAGMFVGGFAISLFVSLRLAVLQSVVPHEIQGRVITVALSSTALTDPIGLAAAGPVAAAIGVRPLFVICGIVTLAVGILAFALPAVMRIERGNPAEAPAQA